MPGDTAKDAPDSLARLISILCMTVPTPMENLGKCFVTTSRAENPSGVRSVISIADRPPSNIASARGTASSIFLIVKTGIIRHFFSICSNEIILNFCATLAFLLNLMGVIWYQDISLHKSSRCSICCNVSCTYFIALDLDSSV